MTRRRRREATRAARLPAHRSRQRRRRGRAAGTDRSAWPDPTRVRRTDAGRPRRRGIRSARSGAAGPGGHRPRRTGPLARGIPPAGRSDRVRPAADLRRRAGHPRARSYRPASRPPSRPGRERIRGPRRGRIPGRTRGCRPGRTRAAGGCAGRDGLAAAPGTDRALPAAAAGRPPRPEAGRPGRPARRSRRCTSDVPAVTSGLAVGVAWSPGSVSILVSFVVICFGVVGSAARLGPWVAGAFAVLGRAGRARRRSCSAAGAPPDPRAVPPRRCGSPVAGLAIGRDELWRGGAGAHRGAGAGVAGALA